MELFRKNKKETVVRNYPTEEEYLAEIIRIQNEELNSDRYEKVRKSLENYYWNRENKDLEEELFKIVGSYGIEDDLICMSDNYQKNARLKRYTKLKSFLNSLTEEQINSNIFLKSAKSFMRICVDDCSIIINELNTRLNNKILEIVTVEVDIPDKMKMYIPEYINSEIGIKYYRPEAFKTAYINILDDSHIYVYDDYNRCVRNIVKIAEDIYFLQLTKMLATVSKYLVCYHFQVYHNEYDNLLISSFFIKNRMNYEKKTAMSNYDFVQKALSDYKQLLDMESIPDNVLKNKNKSKVLNDNKKTSK